MPICRLLHAVRISSTMRSQNIIRVFLFVVFSGFGVASLAGAILCEELVGHYRDRQLLKEARKSTEKLKALNADYDVLLERLEDDPNLFKRISIAVLGDGPNEPNTAYPKARAEQLAAAREALTEANDESAKPTMPEWLTRCTEPRRRIMLFVCGAALILISFACFGPARRATQPEQS